jgi:hypothetical protein
MKTLRRRKGSGRAEGKRGDLGEKGEFAFVAFVANRGGWEAQVVAEIAVGAAGVLHKDLRADESVRV